MTGSHRAPGRHHQNQPGNQRWRWLVGMGAVVALGALGVHQVLAEETPPPAPVEQFTSRITGVSALPEPPDGPSWAPDRRTAPNGLKVAAQAMGEQFVLYTKSGAKTFLPGVNLGSTTPGHQPGELAVTAEDYRTWFAAMDRMGIRVVRVYTIHPPAFYQELAAYNRTHPERALYLVQGVYLPDESYARKGDLYDEAVTTAFVDELRDASAAVSGGLEREPRRGRSHGTWTADVSPWLAAWIIGVEWDPSGVHESDRKNAGRPSFTGRYFRSTPEATPTERWLATRMDELASAEAARGRSAPVAFVNWPTTDPLRHPEEPLPQEDLAGVDANHVLPTEQWPGGTFASYHAYPYYPDFQRHEPALQKAIFNGRPDPYAGYLTALRRHHKGMPVMVTEFGVPSSLGTAHAGPLGRGQGDHGEREAMTIGAELLRVIRGTGMAGGFLFGWADEWFKFTWNTIAHQAPAERRQLWHDPLTNEQHFGIIATDPTGPPEGWPRQVLDEPDSPIATRAVAAVDEAYLQLGVDLAKPAPKALTIGLDVLPEIAGSPPPGSTDEGADLAIQLDLAKLTGQVWVRERLDPLPLDYQVPAGLRAKAVNGWQRYQLVINRDLTVPTTGRKLPAELFDVGVLNHGVWDPAAQNADNRNLWRLTGDGTLTIRVPWAFAGFADPSSLQVLVPDGNVPTTRTATGVRVRLAADGALQPLDEITWEPWNRVYYAERLKAGADVLRAAMLETGAGALPAPSSSPAPSVTTSPNDGTVG
ncbi:hypothetical protein [Catenuloplanes atrovinosus]|uniref:Uncharacterized protein n=1 Tax=Catenuloplanes atrovinosus TaxID=137266 RepID=A0AAE3YP37_9ACTN|nr:hypothetical protein [Catenuloplanes atrovinosus]MDR7276055.1 hypothetical protein [Catenuloplanes atrovinosus]